MSEDFNNSTNKQDNHIDVAIIGMSCRFPGAIRYRYLWENLINGVNSIDEIPPDRWDINQYYSTDINAPGKTISKWGGFLKDIDLFDNKFFNISPREARNMDPQQRLLLEETWHCIEDSGLALDTLRKKMTSVYVGVMAMDYYDKSLESNTFTDAFSAAGNYGCILANRISYYYGFRGVSMTIDTACSSSLVALDAARRALYLGESDYFVVAGVSLSYSPFKYISFSKSRMLSPDGQCKTFDKSANGYVIGEGAGVLLLQPLDKAIEEGNNIYGVLKGSSVNHVGKSVSMTAPRVETQADLLRSAFKNARVEPNTINYIEAHGTGTSLGDPIEVEGLTRAFNEYTDRKQYCKIGSIKTNIGHLEAASGIAGVIKVLMMFKHKKIPRTLNIKTLNPIIDFENSPFEVAIENSEWDTIGYHPRRAGVSSFGFGGTNAHVVLEEYNPPEDPHQRSREVIEIQDQSRQHVFILSANNSMSLERIINYWSKYVDQSDFEKYRLEEICQTLKVARVVFSERFGVVVDNKRQLRNAIIDAVVDDYTQSEKYKAYKSCYDKNLVFNIGDAGKFELSYFWNLYKNDTSFKESFDECRWLISEIAFLDVLHADPEAQRKYQDLYSFSVVYALMKKLLNSGIYPDLICGEGIGQWVAMCISGVVDLKDCLLSILDRNHLRRIDLKRPKFPVYFQSQDLTIRPFYFDAEYRRLLIKDMNVSDSVIHSYIHKANLLLGFQHTFIRLIDEWNSHFMDDDELNLYEMLKDNKWWHANDEETQGRRLLLLIIILDCTRTLNRKWNLKEKMPPVSPGVQELLDLIADQVMARDEVIALLKSDFADFSSLARKVQARQARLDLNKPYEYLRKINIYIKEIENRTEWISQIGEENLDPAKFEKELNLHVGDFHSLAKGNNHIHFVLNEHIEKSMAESALQLWLRGVDLDWSKYNRIKPNLKVAALPVYFFNRSSHWIDSEQTSKERKERMLPESDLLMEKTVANTPDWDNFPTSSQEQPQIIGQPSNAAFDQSVNEVKTTLLYQPDNHSLIRDHEIAERKIIPGAVLLEAGFEYFNTIHSSSANVLQDIVFHNPGFADIECKVDIEVIRNQKEIGIYVDDTTVFKCNADRLQIGNPEPLNWTNVSNSQIVEGAELYNSLKEKGYHYGPSLQVIDYCHIHQQATIGELSTENTDDTLYSTFNPALFDGILQFLIWAGEYHRGIFKSDLLFLPHKIKILKIWEHITDHCTVVVDHNEQIHLEGRDLVFNAKVYNRLGACVMEMEGVHFKMITTHYLADPTVSDSFDSMENAWFFQPTWESHPLTNASLTEFDGNCIVFSNLSGSGEVLADKLRALAKSSILVEPASLYQKFNDSHFQIDYANEENFNRLLTEISQIEGINAPDNPIAVYYLAAYDNASSASENLETLENKLNRGLYPLFFLSKALIKSKFNQDIHLTIATSDATATTRQDPVLNFEYGSLSGLAKVLNLEEKRVNVQLIDFTHLDELQEKDLSDIILSESFSEQENNIIAIRQNRKYIQKIQSCKLDSGEPSLLKNKGVYLVVGGLGGIGQRVASYIVQQVEARLVIVGRSSLDAKKQALVNKLEKLGGEVMYIQADICDSIKMESVINRTKVQFGGLNGVFQCAGQLEDQLLLSNSLESFQRVTSSKIQGTFILDKVTRNENLDFFLVFSSIVSVLGNVGQSDYAAGNAFLDSFIHYRRRRGGPGKSACINWTAWEGDGMADSEEAISQFIERGVIPITRSRAVGALGQILREMPTQVVVTADQANSVNWETPRRIVAGDTPVIYPELDETVAEDAQSQREEIFDYLSSLIREKLSINEPTIDPKESFFSIGMESILVNEIMAILSDKFDGLPSTLLFEQPNLESLTDYIVQKKTRLKRLTKKEPTPVKLKPKPKIQPPPKQESKAPLKIEDNVKTVAPPSVVKQTTTIKKQKSTEYDIAVIGMSGRFPQAPDFKTFWKILSEGKDCIQEIPTERWNHDLYFDPDKNHKSKTYGKWGGFIEDVDKFDPLLFKISPREAEQMDPQQRLFLESVWETMEDAGYGKMGSFSNDKVGVFVGTMWNEYSILSHESGFQKNHYSGPGSLYWMIANRVSFFFDFKGPSMAVDTACSSSLTAIHLACRSIMSGDCNLAIAGGVNLNLHPGKYQYLGQAKFLASDGRCRSFGVGGDGYVPSEGVGSVLLKPLEQATADRDNIYGVIKGSSLNHGGKSTALTVPNPEAQASLIAEAFTTANIKPDDLGYIECHGTGTALGDPIEISGLANAFAKLSSKKQFCAIGSAKSNIGHLEASAGIAGLIKVLLSFKHNKIPKTIHSEEINPKLNLEESPFYLAHEIQDWPNRDEKPKLAGLSSFGAGGANAHLVIQEYQKTEKEQLKELVPDKEIFVLSAQTRELLDRYVARWIGYLEEGLQNTYELPKLSELTFTLQTGREEFDERLAILVEDYPTLLKKLKQFQSGDEFGSDIFHRNIRQDSIRNGFAVDEETLVHWKGNGDLSSIAEAWTIGQLINWKSIEKGNKQWRCSLPVYPFARERYWLTEPDHLNQESSVSKTGVEIPATNVLHPLVDCNISTLESQKFKKNFNPNDFWVAQHVVDGYKTLPAAAYLEMILTTSRLSSDRYKFAGISNIAWSQPFRVDRTNKEVQVQLTPQENTRLNIEITSFGENEKTIYSQGQAIYKIPEQTEIIKENVEKIDLPAFKSSNLVRHDLENLYEDLQSIGLLYGPGFQSIKEFRSNENEALVLLSLPQEAPKQTGEFRLHPVLLDGAFQAAFIWAMQEKEGITTPYLPYSLEQLDFIESMGESCYAYITNVANFETSAIQVFDISLYDTSGSLLVRMHKFSLKQMTQHKEHEVALEDLDDDVLTLLEKVKSGQISDDEFKSLFNPN